MIPLNIQPPIPLILFPPIIISPKIINNIENKLLLMVHDLVFCDINNTMNVMNPADVRKPPILPSLLRKGTIEAPFSKDGHSGDKLGWNVFIITNNPENPKAIIPPSKIPGCFFCKILRARHHRLSLVSSERRKFVLLKLV